MSKLGRLATAVAASCIAPALATAAPRTGPIFVLPQEHDTPRPKKEKPPRESLPPKRIEPKAVDACREAVVQIDEGIVSVELSNTELAGRKVDYRLGRFTTSAVGDRGGHVRLLAPLFTRNGTIEWRLPGSASCDRPVAFPNYENAFVFAISWVEPPDAPLELDLHAVEPKSAIGARSGYVSRTHPLGDADTQGIFRSFGNGGAGAMHMQYYFVPSFRKPSGGPFKFRVEFTSRGNPHVPPFCGDYPYAHVSYRYYGLSHGELLDRGASFNPRPCGGTFADPVQGFASFDMKP